MIQAETLSAQELLEWAIREHGRDFAVITSFQREGMVLLDLAVRISPDVRIISLDTGRLPPETYDIVETVRARYGVKIELISPEGSEVERMVERFGPNLFYESVPYRNLCCHIRKVRPLERATAELQSWAVGLRRGQSEGRAAVQKVEEKGRKWKLSPLADWTAEQVSEYIAKHDVPMHPLYAKGYTSIGCGPCSRPTTEGEDERAGRWWWEIEGKKECGIHFSPEGRVERTMDVLLREILPAD